MSNPKIGHIESGPVPFPSCECEKTRIPSPPFEWPDAVYMPTPRRLHAHHPKRPTTIHRLIGEDAAVNRWFQLRQGRP